MPNQTLPAEQTANEALQQASAEVLQATYDRLQGGTGTGLEAADVDLTGCQLTHKSTNRAGSTGYPIIQLVALERAARGAPGTIQAWKPNVQANRLVAFLFAP